MSTQVKPNYINPLTMMKEKQKGRLAFESLKQDSQKDKVTELQTKQQQIQNEILLLKFAGTDAPAGSAERQEMLNAKLEEVSTQLQSAQSDTITAPKEAASQIQESQQANSITKNSTVLSKLKQDTFEKSQPETESPGIYRLEQEESSAYKISFSPYSE